MKKWLVIIALISLVAGCVSGSKLQPEDKDLASAVQKVPNITMDELNRGYKLYIDYCSACHRLHKPDEFTISQWNKILPEMYSKAKLVSDDKKESIRNYVIAKSK
jgi:cytochrome c1